ncbi:MAG: cytochrome b/b6 domain-containing protein [Gammaproteobacteria bacterium]|nr:cytochrome b/b6 domain-containing protein [Gammaproteobacteria bacterium]
MNASDNTAPQLQWSRPLRLLHFSLAVAVTIQLFVGSFMRSPHTGRPDTFGFETHEILGFTILVLVLLHWLWSATHPTEGLRHLFPWSGAGLRRVTGEFWQALRYRQLPPGGPGLDGGLAGFVHGLGLLSITAIALTGGTFYLVRMAGAGRNALEIIEDIHDTFAVIAWIYWSGHLAITVLHSLFGHPTFKGMFNLRG